MDVTVAADDQSGVSIGDVVAGNVYQTITLEFTTEKLKRLFTSRKFQVMLLAWLAIWHSGASGNTKAAAISGTAAAYMVAQAYEDANQNSR